MPKKYEYTEEALEMLESLWDQGMKNCSTNENKQRIQQASAATGLVDERIKLWIYSRNRKERKEDGTQSARKRPCPSTSEAVMPAEGITHNFVDTLIKDEGLDFQEQSDNILDSSSANEQLNGLTADLPGQTLEDSQDEAVAHLIKCIEEKVLQLQACHCDIVFMVYNHRNGSMSTTGTMRGLEFLRTQSPGIDIQFAANVSSTS